MQKKPNPATLAALATAAAVVGGSMPDKESEPRPPAPEYQCECGTKMRLPQKPDKSILAYCPKCGRLKRK